MRQMAITRTKSSGSTGALLASTERYAAGWRAFVDGAAQPVQKVNLYFRGLVLPPGEHMVVWEYRPARWVPLVWTSYLTLAGATLVGGTRVTVFVASALTSANLALPAVFRLAELGK